MALRACSEKIKFHVPRATKRIKGQAVPSITVQGKLHFILQYRLHDVIFSEVEGGQNRQERKNQHENF